MYPGGSLTQYVPPLENLAFQREQGAGEKKAADKLFKSLDEASPLALAKIGAPKAGPVELAKLRTQQGRSLLGIA